MKLPNDITSLFESQYVYAILAVLAGAVFLGLLNKSSTINGRSLRKKTTIPQVPSSLPYFGSALDYFQSPVQFTWRQREKYGDTYSAIFFGRENLFLHSKVDIESILRAPERDISFLEAYRDLAGSSLPQDNEKQYSSEQQRDLISGNRSSATGQIAHSVRPNKTRAWIPAIRQVLTKSFDKLPETGKVDLFEWTRELICAVTVRVLLGDRVLQDPGMLEQWVALFHQADPEQGFSNPLNAVSTMVETTLLGERRVYSRVRALIFPYVDAEIEACINAGYCEPESSDDDASVLSSLIRSWYTMRLKRNADNLRAARLRLANDMFNFTFAAFSNSFASAGWCLFHILRNTNDNIGDRIKAELDGSSKNPELCPELEKTIMEIGRLYTPGAVLRKLKVNWMQPSTGEVIPAGTTVLISAFHSMREPKYFSKPLQLVPDRFETDEIKNAGALYFPFGTGTHPCVGRKFAVLEISLFVQEALRQFDLALVEDDNFGRDDEWTKKAVDMPNHPPLDFSQAGFIWRPIKQIIVSYKKKIR